MTHTNQILVTVIVIIVAILIVLWLLRSFKRDGDDGNCFAPKPDPVGGIRTEKTGPGELKICWDETPNATSYRVFINEVSTPVANGAPQSGMRKSGFNVKNRANHPLAACGDSSCCTKECNDCVTQSKYTKVIETCETCITIKSCEARICFIVVPYNKCNQAGKCREIQYAELDCMVNEITAWVVKNDCRGLEVRWNCIECCQNVLIYVNRQLVETVPCSNGVYTSEGIACCDELAIACETSCGIGERTIVVPGCPEGVMTRSPEELVQAQQMVSKGRKAQVHRVRSRNTRQ